MFSHAEDIGGIQTVKTPKINTSIIEEGGNRSWQFSE